MLYPSNPPSRVSGIYAQNLEFATDRRRARVHVSVTWEVPQFRDTYGSCHAVEVPFIFDNVHAAPQWFDAEADARTHELATNLSKAWTSFAHGGAPYHSSMPAWPPYTLDDRATMTLNYSCELTRDPGRNERVAFEKLRAERIP